MNSFVKLSVGASIALILAACSSSTDTTTTTTTDSGTTADTGAKPDTGTVADTGAKVDANTGDDDASTGDDASTCPLTADQPFKGEAACDKCLHDSCCDTVVACGSDQACVAAFNCIIGCNNGEEPNDAGTFDAGDQSDGGPLDTCINSCTSAATPAVLTELNGFVGCLSGTCATDCGN